MKSTMNRDICAQIDERLVALFDKIPDAANKTPSEFFLEVFSSENVSRDLLKKDAHGRSFVNNIVASMLPEADEMVVAIVNLAISNERRYLDRLINSAANLAVDACQSRRDERIGVILDTGCGRGRLTEVDDQGNLKIFNTTPDDLPRRIKFFEKWRSSGNKCLFDYCLQDIDKPKNQAKYSAGVWELLGQMFPDKKLDPNSATYAYRTAGVRRLVQVLESSEGKASLTEIDESGKLKIFGSEYEWLSSTLRFTIDDLEVKDLEEFFRRWRSSRQDWHKSLLDYCIEAATRQENPVTFHPSVWHLLRKIFVAQFAEIDLRYEVGEARDYNPADSVDCRSVLRLNKFTEDSIEMSESDFQSTEGRLKTFALDKNGKTSLQVAAEKDNHELVTRIIGVSPLALYINRAELLQNAGEKTVSTLVYQLERFVSQEIKPNVWAISKFLISANPLLLNAIVNRFGDQIRAQSLEILIREGHTNFLNALIRVKGKEHLKDEVLAKILRILPSLLYSTDRSNADLNISVVKLSKFVAENYSAAEQEKFVAVQTNGGITPFHIAAHFGDVEALQAMYATDAGKKAAQVRSDYGTPLVLAMRRGKGNLKAIEQLLDCPEVQETLEATDNLQKNIFHLTIDSKHDLDPEVLGLILRKFPKLTKLLAMKYEYGGDTPIASFREGHLQVLVELAGEEIEGFSLPNECMPSLINRFIMTGIPGLIPMIAASAEGRAALSSFDKNGILPLREAIHRCDLATVKNLLACEDVRKGMLLRNEKGETIFHPLNDFADSQIRYEILEYVLGSFPESRTLLLQTEQYVSVLRGFCPIGLQIAFSYLTKEQKEELLLSTKGNQHNLVQAALEKVKNPDGVAWGGSKEKAERLLKEMDKCSDDLDKKKAVFTKRETGLLGKDKGRFIDGLPEYVRNLIPQKFLTTDIESGVLDVIVGLIRCAQSSQQARDVLNAKGGDGLSLYQRMSPEQRSVVDLAFDVSPALNSALATTTVAPSVSAEHAGSSSLQSASTNSTGGVSLAAGNSDELRKRLATDDSDRDNKSRKLNI